MGFGIVGFRRLIAGLREGGYSFRLFHEDVRGRSILLRHDIDFSVEYAVAMAREEHALGVQATYFFMLTSNSYNLLSYSNRRLLREIASLGHAVGLHFDAAIYDDIETAFRVEADTIQSFTGLPVKFVSLHRPGPFLNNNNQKLPGVRHTYEDEFFRNIKYVSDSGGTFKYGHPLDTDAFARGEPIHLLLHPIWWMTEPGSPSDKLRAWQGRTLEFINEETSANCLTFDGKSIIQA